jgi:tetratricopeptide (TPR) repeat protein
MIEEIKKKIEEKEYQSAYQLLSENDQDNLYIHGEYEPLINLYTKLEPHIEGVDLLGLKAKLGRVYYRTGQHDLAEKYLKEASSADSVWELFALSILGGMYIDLERDEAKETLERVIKEARKAGKEQILGGSLVRLAKLENDPELIREAILIAKRNNRERDLNIWSGCLAVMESDTESLEKLIPYFEENNDKRFEDMFKRELKKIN